MPLLVLGSKGFIGSKVLFYCNKLNIPALGLTKEEWSEIKNHDISLWCKEKNITQLIYCAGYSKRFNSNEIDYIKELEVISKFLVINNLNITYLSSSLVYGKRKIYSENFNLSENLLCHPIGSYGLYKRILERIILSTNKNNKIIRLASCIGKEKKTGLLKIIEEKIIEDSKNIKMFFGNTLRDYIFVDNAAKAIIEITRNSNAKGIFNLGSNKGLKVEEIITRFARYHKKDIHSIEFGENMDEDPMELILNMKKTISFISKNTWHNINSIDQLDLYLLN